MANSGTITIDATKPSREPTWAITLDTRLVAAVQAAAGGARCHEAASLVQAYYFRAEVCRRACTGRAGDATVVEARRLLDEAKGRLRDFLAERLLGWVRGGDGKSPRHLNRDHPTAAAARCAATTSSHY